MANMKPAFLAFAFLACSTIAAAESEDSGGRVVRFSVEQEQEFEANRATLKLQVTKKQKSLKVATTDCNRVIENVRKRLVGTGIRKDDIITRSFSSAPQQGFFTDKVRQYEVTGTIDVRVLEPRRLGKFLEPLAEADQDLVIRKLEFDHTNQDSIREILVAGAAQKAEAKKKAYEHSFGFKLRIKELVEGMVETRPTRRYGPLLEQVRKGAMAMVREEDMGRNIPVLKHRLRLNMVYEITE